MPSDLATPTARIHRLEQEIQRIRILGLATVLLALAMTLSGFGQSAEPVVRAERLELVSTQGVRQAVLSADTLGFLVMLFDQRGRPSGRLRLTAEPRLSIETGRGEEVAGLEAPKLLHLIE